MDYHKIIITCIVFFSVFLNTSVFAKTLDHIYNEQYEILDSVKSNKQNEILSYLKRVQTIAHRIKTDKEMGDLFIMKRHLYRQTKDNTKIDTEKEKMRVYLRKNIIQHYMDKYLIFYDLLFIDNTGDIFYTNRRQSDYHLNIFNSRLSTTALSKQLMISPNEAFVDFHNYEISNEPSAFFVEPYVYKGKLLGWYVFQFAINKINTMFSVELKLGKTGEVFLVNKDRYMLTDSRFYPNSTILKKHLSIQNISAKFKEKSGHKFVTDYRGFNTLTSFKVIEVFGSQWLLIAKIDEDEVLTNHYKGLSAHRRSEFFDKIADRKPHISHTNSEIQSGIEVDMDEYKRAANHEILYTHGVSACTTFIVSLKNKFAYMAHVSAYDKIYGGDQTDLLNRIMKRIDEFDAVNSEKRMLEVQIISPHIRFSKNVIDVFVDWGLQLSQLKIINNPDAKYANISHDYKNGNTNIQWKMLNLDKVVNASTEGIPNLLELLKKITLSSAK